MMTEIERLTALEEIKELKARYFRCLDTKDWAGLQAVFSDDAEFDMRGEAADKSTAANAVIVGEALLRTGSRQRGDPERTLGVIYRDGVSTAS